MIFLLQVKRIAYAYLAGMFVWFALCKMRNPNQTIAPFDKSLIPAL